MIHSATRPGRTRIRLLAAAAILPAIVLLGLAMVPVGSFRGAAEDALSHALGRRVTIGALARTDTLSFVPTVRLTDIRVANPAWAGPAPAAVVRSVTVRLPVLPLLFGQVHPHAIAVDGARLMLVRDAAGRESWSESGRRHGSSGDVLANLASLDIADTSIRWRDIKRGMDLAVAVSADASGLRLNGTGRHRGTPLRLSAMGGPVDRRTAARPYPFAARLTSPLLAIRAEGRMARPLDLADWSAQVAVRSTDARRVDDLLQVGLPGTQPLAFTADVTRAGDTWRLERARATLGRSHFDARLTVAHAGGRTRLVGTVDAADFDFDDLASDEAHARQHARSAVTGPRIFPETPIRLDRLATLDGRIDLRTRRLLVRGGSMFRTLAGTLTLDHRQLDVSPLAAGLEHGVLTGRAHVDHRTGTPLLSLDLRVHDEQISDFFAGQNRLVGPIQGRVRLAGRGDTVRAALGASSGRVGIVSRNGTLQRKLAIFAGGDLLKGVEVAVGGGGDRRVAVGCLIAGFDAADGILRPDPLLLDTPVSRLDGNGIVSLRDERVALVLHGRPKQPSAIRADPPIRVAGTLSDPSLTIGDSPPAEHEGLLGQIGHVLGALKIGHAERAVAPPADCARLAALALR